MLFSAVVERDRVLLHDIVEVARITGTVRASKMTRSREPAAAKFDWRFAILPVVAGKGE